MIREKSMKLLHKLKAELDSRVEVDVSPIQKLKECLSLVSNALVELKTLVISDGFGSVSEEIDFFKSIKPAFYAELIYASELFGFENGKPVLVNGLPEYYNEQLIFILRFFRQHEFMYQYFRLGAEEMDTVYFVRGNVPIGVLGLGVPELDPSFATAGDYLFSKFIAYEKLQALILAQMQVPVTGDGASVRSKKGRVLRWTGDSCNLIELVYGIFDTKQVNDGEIDLSDLMDVFEQCFQINLSRYFRRFTEIKRRKSISKTKFLDSMVAAVNKRIDEGDAYVPSSLR
jgi:hypothetical protein